MGMSIMQSVVATNVGNQIGTKQVQKEKRGVSEYKICPLCLCETLKRVQIDIGDKRKWICEDCRDWIGDMHRLRDGRREDRIKREQKQNGGE